MIDLVSRYLVESLGLACASITFLSVADSNSPKMWLYCLPGHTCHPSTAAQYDPLPAWKRGTEAVLVSICLLESLVLTCASIAFLSVADSRKMWLQCLPGHSCRPSIASQYYSLPAWKRITEEVIVSSCLVESLSLTCASITLFSVADSPKM